MTTTDIHPPSYQPSSWDRPRDRQDSAQRDARRQDSGWHDPQHDDQARHGHRRNWLSRAEGWLDDKGKGAWIAAMILGFVVFWPVGLGLLAYMIWSKRMFSKSCNRHRSHRAEAFHAARAAMRPSGNTAFDSYKTETLRRLEDEQQAFEDFLSRLRAAKDKAEFDQFMEDRARRPEPRDTRAQDGDAMPEPSGH